MEVFIFIGKGGFCGATQEPSAASLPHVSGPWRFLKKTKLSREQGINRTIAISDIRAKGYYLLKSEHLSGTFGNA
jgi:hypothetical protein